VYAPVSEEEAREAIRYFKQQRVQSIAICFLWSFKNPINERLAAEICRKEFPSAYLSISSEMLPEIGE